MAAATSSEAQAPIARPVGGMKASMPTPSPAFHDDVVMRKIDFDTRTGRSGRSRARTGAASARRHLHQPSDSGSIASSSLSSASSSIRSLSPPPSSSSSILSPTFTDSLHEVSGSSQLHGSGWTTSLSLHDSWKGASRTPSLRSPLTPASFDDGCSLDALEGIMPSSPPMDYPDADSQSQPPTPKATANTPYSIPYRPKCKKHRQSWDSGLGSDINGRHTRGNSMAGIDVSVGVRESGGPGSNPTNPEGMVIGAGRPHLFSVSRRPTSRGTLTSDYAGSISSIHETDNDGVLTSTVGLGDRVREILHVYGGRHPGPGHVRGVSPDRSDWDETASGTTVPAEDAADRILNYTLDVAFGLAFESSNLDASVCRSVVHNFISDLAWVVGRETAEPGEFEVPEDSDFGDAEDSEEPASTAAHDAGASPSQPTGTSSGASDTARSSQSNTSRSSGRAERGKRKSRDSNDDQDADEGFDDGELRQKEPAPSKRAKLEPVVRISCPYRKKNPLRFNVRDYRLCAMTVFTDTAELRRHIQDCHRRPAYSPHKCPRCQAQFFAQEDLREHLLFRDGILCPVVNPTVDVHNPEDGIDNATAEKLRSKKGRVSDPIEVQWQKIWHLLFPNSAVEPYEYCAVMEHHELYAKLCISMSPLMSTLSAVGLGERGLNTLRGILDNHFIDLFEQCNEEGRRKEYKNRQPKAPQNPAAGQLRPKQPPLKQWPDAAKRDSGFVDDESIEKEASEAEGISTPALTPEEGLSPGLGLGVKNLKQTQMHAWHPQGVPNRTDLDGQGESPGFPVYPNPYPTSAGQYLDDARCGSSVNISGHNENVAVGVGPGIAPHHSVGSAGPWPWELTVTETGEVRGPQRDNSTAAWVYGHGQPSFF